MLQEDFNNASGMIDNSMSPFPPYTPVGMCYVPMQRITTVYEPDNAFMRGTLFPDLDKPFLDGRGFEK